MAKPPTTIEEYRLAQVESRLADGAKTFGTMRDEIKAVGTRNTRLLGGLFVVIVGGAVSFGVLINRVDDTATTQERHESKIEEVKEDVAEIERAQDRLGTAVETLQATIDSKLDRALAAPDPMGRRRPR
jgi:hypothetical protein